MQKQNFIPDKIVCDKLGPNIEFGVTMISGKIFHETSETFIEPQMGPPFLIIQIILKQITKINEKVLVLNQLFFNTLTGGEKHE